MQQDELPWYHLNSLFAMQAAIQEPFRVKSWLSRYFFHWIRPDYGQSSYYYVTCNTGTLTHMTAQRNCCLLSMRWFFIYIHTSLHTDKWSATLQRSGSRATFRHSDQTILTSPVLSAGLPALLLPFTAIAIKNCTFLVYQPRATLSSTIYCIKENIFLKFYIFPFTYTMRRSRC